VGWDLVALLIQNIEDCQPHVRVTASIRHAIGDSVCRTDHAEYQSQSKRDEKRREDASHSQGKFFHLIGSPIFSLIVCHSSSGCSTVLTGKRIPAVSTPHMTTRQKPKLQHCCPETSQP
jgi:hypothetical protein